MFTVKVCHKSSGEDTIFEASQVRKTNAEQSDGVVGRVYCDTEGGQIIYDISDPRGPCGSNDGTRLFVMNRFGATVANYDL